MNRMLEAAGITYSQLFDEVPCWISIQDRAFKVIEANRKLIADFGDHRLESCYSMYKGRSEPCQECPVARTFEDGSNHTGQQLIFDRNGLPHDVIVTTRPLRDQGGRVVAVMKVFADISGEKELENRLHDSVVLFHNLFDHAPCMISVHDRNFRITQSNQGLNEKFGDANGKHCFEVYKHRCERCTKCPVADTFTDGKAHTGEEVLVDKHGREIHVLVYTAPLMGPRGELTAVIKMSTDVTEIKALQNRLATLGQLVGGIAHSIKNVLEGLRGGVYIVNLGFRDNNHEDVRTGWEMVERNVARLSSMILDMLRCAKDRTPRPLPISMTKVVREVIALFAPRAAGFGVALEHEASSDIEVLGEEKELHSLLANLVSNAIDACNADQDEQKTHRVLVRLAREGDEAIVEVEDNGIGMEPDVRQALFHDMVSTKGSSGTGLGLLVAHKIASEHGAKIGVRSEPGKGSLFTARFCAQADIRKDRGGS